jgi:uncharacterized membrane protein
MQEKMLYCPGDFYSKKKGKMKKYFITGLVILLPLALTLAIVMLIVNLLTTPFVGIVQSILEYFDLLDKGILFLSSEQVQIVFSKIIILILLFFTTVALGALGRWFFFHYMLNLWDYVLHRIPLVSSIYKACQEVIKNLFTSKTKSFKQVVMVPFPSRDTYTLGLVTGENIKGLPQSSQQNVISVFVPTTPNPTSGFMMMFAEQDVIYLDMKIEDAFKYIISCGMIVSPINTISSEAAHELSKDLTPTS